MDWFPFIWVILIWASLCALQDAYHGRISNLLTYPAIIVALCHLVLCHESIIGATPSQAMLASGCALLIGLPGFLLRKLGGGDVKMLFAVGLASSPLHLLASIVLASLVMLVWQLLLNFQPGRRLALSKGSTLIYGPFLLAGMVPVFILLI